MTFNQWCGGRNLKTSERLCAEAVWNAMVDGATSSESAGRLMSDLLDEVDRSWNERGYERNDDE